MLQYVMHLYSMHAPECDACMTMLRVSRGVTSERVISVRQRGSQTSALVRSLALVCALARSLAQPKLVQKHMFISSGFSVYLLHASQVSHVPQDSLSLSEVWQKRQGAQRSRQPASERDLRPASFFKETYNLPLSLPFSTGEGHQKHAPHLTPHVHTMPPSQALLHSKRDARICK